MNAVRFAVSLSLCCCAALVGRARATDESENAASASYGYEFMAEEVTADAMNQAPAQRPAEVTGRLPPEAIRDVVRAGFGAFGTCAAKSPDASSSAITMRFTIDQDGVPGGVRAANTADESLGAC